MRQAEQTKQLNSEEDNLCTFYFRCDVNHTVECRHTITDVEYYIFLRHSGIVVTRNNSTRLDDDFCTFQLYRILRLLLLFFISSTMG